MHLNSIGIYFTNIIILSDGDWASYYMYNNEEVT